MGLRLVVKPESYAIKQIETKNSDILIIADFKNVGKDGSIKLKELKKGVAIEFQDTADVDKAIRALHEIRKV